MLARRHDEQIAERFEAMRTPAVGVAGARIGGARREAEIQPVHAFIAQHMIDGAAKGEANDLRRGDVAAQFRFDGCALFGVKSLGYGNFSADRSRAGDGSLSRGGDFE